MKLMKSNFTPKKKTKAVFNRNGIYPQKRLGQNFLIDKFAIKKVIGATELTKKDIVLEIGPGSGNLTQELAQKAKRVIAVEKDPMLARILNNELKGENIKIVKGDILKLDPKSYILNPYKVVANLPFYIVGPTIRKFLESKFPPKYMVLIVQKEVAQRIVARPPKMNLLAVAVQFYSHPQIIGYISRKSFWPEPKVDSAIIKITINEEQASVNKDLFFKIVKAGFSQPRKTLINNLAKQLKVKKEKVAKIIQKNRTNPLQRPQTLTVKDWENLTRDFSTPALL